MLDTFGNPVPENAMVVRATEVPAFLGCRRKWYFESHNGLNLEPIRTSNKLLFGKAWHTALEYLYTDRDPLEGFMSDYNQDMKELQINDPDIFFSEEHQKEMKESKELAQELLPLYVEWACKDALPSDNELTPIAVERRYLIPVTDIAGPPNGENIPVYLAVKIDAVMCYQHTKLVYAMEHKTMSKSSSVGNPENLPLDIQMGLQLWTLREVARLQGMAINVAGDLFNLMRKQKPSARVKAPIFGRHEVLRSNQELDILHGQLCDIATAMAWAADHPTQRFHNPQPWAGVCTWGCAFRDVCIAMQRGEEYEWVMNAVFKSREKDIWQTLKEEMEGGGD